METILQKNDERMDKQKEKLSFYLLILGCFLVFPGGFGAIISMSPQINSRVFTFIFIYLMQFGVNCWFLSIVIQFPFHKKGTIEYNKTKHILKVNLIGGIVIAIIIALSNIGNIKAALELFIVIAPLEIGMLITGSWGYRFNKSNK